jgi:hypothetical protein
MPRNRCGKSGPNTNPANNQTVMLLPIVTIAGTGSPFANLVTD